MSRDEVCAACKFWQQHPKSDDAGECRKLPPRVFLLPTRGTVIAMEEGGGYAPVAVFAPTRSTTWCGAFEMDDDEGDAV